MDKFFPESREKCFSRFSSVCDPGQNESLALESWEVMAQCTEFQIAGCVLEVERVGLDIKKCG